MVEKKDILDILKSYDKDNITIATLGSHTSLHILKGAKKEGFKTLVITVEGKDIPYKRFKVADEFLYIEKYSDITSLDIQKKLREKNAIVIPHGSFIAYAGLDNLEKNFYVPLFGNRFILRWESERDLERKLLSEAKIRIPRKYEKPEDIDGPVIVKFPGARGGRGYFVCNSPREFYEKFENFVKKGFLTPEDINKAHIEEYIIGTNYCLHYFFSPLKNEVELLGIDRRYESNIDGLVRIPAKDQLELDVSSSFVITGNFPVVIRESLLSQVFEIGDKLVLAAKNIVPPGLIGPFCLQSLCTDNLELVVFEMSARIDGGTNTFMNGSPYSYILYDEPMSMGQRIAREIKWALIADKLDLVLS
ncbi:MAG TPA: formate--phosphoribosylaminoimidazolecarboxamide ligase [Aquificae bacterium]|nr:formate--phosphoribosylaminoimidazolecarboxamide ligase [Aquificota bacterium]